MIRDWYDRGYDALLDYALTNKPAARRLVLATAVSLLVGMVAGLVGFAKMLLQ